MHSSTEMAIRAFRQKIKDEVAILRDLKGRFTDRRLKRKCELAIGDVEAPEMLFLRSLETETWRTPSAEAQAMDYAESIFQLGAQARVQLEEIMKKRGPTARAFPPVA